MDHDLAPPDTAPQHEWAPRPLPLFLDLVRRAGERTPEVAAKALRGLAAYQRAPRETAQRERPILATVRGASLRGCGGSGPPIVLVPSLINPPTILDLDSRTSLAEALRTSGHVLLLDWGAATERRDLDVAGHVEQLLLPLLQTLREAPVLIGYCLGGTLAIAAAALHPVRGVATLAAPWNFDAYPTTSRKALLDLWKQATPSAEPLGVLPIEVLQAAFWSLDPQRVVAKFARLSEVGPNSEESRRFVMLEDWANTGEPLPLPAARELVEDLFEANLPGACRWQIGGVPIGKPSAPVLHFTASEDRIVPAATAPPGAQRSCPAGHVGMVVGRSAPQHLHEPLREWLAHVGPRG